MCKWQRPLIDVDDNKNVNSPIPHVIYLVIGTNDLCQEKQSEETFARQIVSFASYLRKGFGVNCVIIGQILHRHGPKHPNHYNNHPVTRDTKIHDFNTKVNRTNSCIQLKIKEECDPGIIFWRHRGFWHEARGKFHSDGVHIHPHNGLHIYARSVRGAILHAINKIVAVHFNR